jgi:hypothetical protein
MSPLSVAGVAGVRLGFEQLTARYPQIGYIGYLDSTNSTMNPKAREMMAEVVGKYSSRIGAAAIVVHGKGFKATVVRSVITGIHLASRATHPLRACADVESALRWYESKRPQRETGAAELRAVLAALHPPALGAPA